MMQGSNRSGISCSLHPNEEVTNFCLHFECLKPLCPECIETHTRQHAKQEIQSWKNCVNKSARNVKLTLDQLKSLYQRQNQYQSGYRGIDTIEKQNVRILRQIRDRIIKGVQQAFEMHEQKLRAIIKQTYRVDPPDTTKLKMAIEELEKIIMKLGHSSSCIPALKKSLLLDHQSLLNYFSDMKNIQDRGTKLPESFVFENEDFRKLRNTLDNYVVFSIPEVENQKNNESRYQSPPNKPVHFDEPQSSRGPSQSQITPIREDNYFEKKCPHKYLHFFIPVSRELKILSIDSALRGGSWKSIQFDSKRQLPCFFKSIITPDGQIYLTGGSVEQKRHKQIYRYNYQKNSLDFVCKMIHDRSSHSVCYLNNCIYLIGGFSKKEGDVTRDCQVFNIEMQACESIAPLNAPSANSCATAFNNTHIFKFGGVLNKIEGNSLIEMYSVKINKWIVVNIESSKSSPKIELLSFSAAVQTSENEILVFGGYDNTEMEKPERVCYTAEVNPSRSYVLIKNFNLTPLPFAEGFWNNNPIIHDGNVYALQNITDQHDQLTAIADDRRLLVFNGNKWT